MINVCQQCSRLNPLGNKQCNYCQGDCLEMKPLDYGQFLVDKNIGTKTREESWDVDYPDLRLFEACRAMPDQWDLLLARP